jgi:hypothetical protein
MNTPKYIVTSLRSPLPMEHNELEPPDKEHRWKIVTITGGVNVLFILWRRYEVINDTNSKNT